MNELSAVAVMSWRRKSSRQVSYPTSPTKRQSKPNCSTPSGEHSHTVAAALAQQPRIDRQDVAQRHEGRRGGQELGLERRLALRHLEVTVQHLEFSTNPMAAVGGLVWSDASSVHGYSLQG